MPVKNCNAGPSPATLRRDLLKWYRRHQRELPWRPTAQRPANPYHVLVSEAMLQQTQVATVIPYFERFVTALPTLSDLADASQQQVLRLWQGLGYYRRARYLHGAAQKIVADFDGQVPDQVADLLTLPGVGRYTAGAVASIAYGMPAPIVDGNVARVLARLYGIELPVDQPAGRKQLWALAQEVVAPRAAGDFNQAMMELGAMLCTARSPGCDVCPLAGSCAALSQDKVGALPIVTPARQPVAVTHRVLAIERGGRFLFEQRPSTGLWSDMWQLPTAEDEHDIAQRMGLVVDVPGVLGGFVHQTTHRTIRFDIQHASAVAGRLRRGAGVWRRLSQLEDLPLAKPQQRVVQMLQAR